MGKTYYTVNKETVIKLIRFNYGSVRKYCKFAGISATRFYEILNKKHQSLDNMSIRKIALAIFLNPEDIVDIK